jgi:hypothetical protein
MLICANDVAGFWVVWGPPLKVQRRCSALSEGRFLGTHSRFSINERQRVVLNRLLNGFEGKLTATKYATLAKCSQDTALRDILTLVERGILFRNPEGERSTSYALNTSLSSQDFNPPEGAPAPLTKKAMIAEPADSASARDRIDH